MLELKNVSYGYTRGHYVLNAFSLSFTEPGVYGLLGKNGAGKSTMLYLMMGLLRPNSGTVTLDGVPTKDRLPEKLQDMFIVPEEYDLPATTLDRYAASLQLFYPNFDLELLGQLLQNFDLADVVGRYDSSKSVNNIPPIKLNALSMGQKKKIYVCLALAARTRILIMDEPTNGLDIPAKSQFRKIIAQGMRDDQIVIISTHQVRDVETLLDHVTIVNNSNVLVNERIDVEKPINLEEYFISVITREEVKG